MKQLRTLLITGLLGITTMAIAPTTLATTIFRWVDEHGVVHFSQSPPPGVNAVKVVPGQRTPRQATLSNPRSAEPAPTVEVSDAPPVVPSQPDSGAPALSEAQLERERQLEAEAASRLAEIQATRDDNCARAREQFEQFTTIARIRIADENGEERPVTEEERQARIAEAQRAIVQNCGDDATG